MEALNLDQKDPSFVQDILKSHLAVLVIGAWLIDVWKYPTTVHPQRIRPDVEDWEEYQDEGDLTFIKDGESRRGEVKDRPSLHFTRRDKFPFPTVIVEKVRRWDEAVEKPYCFFIVNYQLTRVFVVKAETSSHWVKAIRPNHGRDGLVYECPIELALYYHIV